MSINLKTIEPLKHHDQSDVCVTRARYRQGRKDTAVKVYTINQESKFLLIFNVPAVGAQTELRHLCEGFGEITRLDAVHEYPCEDFTEVYVVCYLKIQAAKFVKRKLNGSSFFGGVLHVCYAPEFESVEDTKQKLIGRTRHLGHLLNIDSCGPWNRSNIVYKPRPAKVVPEPPTCAPAVNSVIADTAMEALAGGSGTYIWAGKVYNIQQSAGGVNTNNVAAQDPLPVVDVARPPITHLLPRQLRPAKRKKVIAVPTQRMLTNDDDSFANSSSDIRSRMSQLTTPTLTTCFKRKRTT